MWAYRVVRFGQEELVICKVYHDADGQPKSYVFDAMASGATFDELADDLEAMAKALAIPPLHVSVFPDAPRNGAN